MIAFSVFLPRDAHSLYESQHLDFGTSTQVTALRFGPNCDPIIRLLHARHGLSVDLQLSADMARAIAAQLIAAADAIDAVLLPRGGKA